MRKPPAELLAELMVHSLMAHTSALVLHAHDSLKCKGVVVEEEEQYKQFPLFPVIVSSVLLMGQSISIGFRKGSTGSHTQSPATDVSTIKAVAKTVATENRNREVVMTILERMATRTTLTNMSVKGTV